MPAFVRKRELDASLNLRITPELKEHLLAAVQLTPGAATASGVVRKAVDHYLEHVLQIADS